MSEPVTVTAIISVIKTIFLEFFIIKNMFFFYSFSFSSPFVEPFASFGSLKVKEPILFAAKWYNC